MCDHIFAEGTLVDEDDFVAFVCLSCGDIDFIDTEELDKVSDIDEDDYLIRKYENDRRV